MKTKQPIRNFGIITIAIILLSSMDLVCGDTRPYDEMQSLYQLVYDKFLKLFLTQDDRFKSIDEIVQANGFKFEEHQVWTHDGYQITLHRIRHRNKYQKAPPVLLQHGIEETSYEWITNSPDKAPALVLARAGFDVWLGNNRGNHFSRKHKIFFNTENLFWEMVDFEEMGVYDLPAEIDFILNYTASSNPLDSKKLAAYIGESQGTTQFFIGSSMKPDYFTDKVNLFVAMAPLVRMDHSTNLALVWAAQFEQHFTWIIRFMNWFDIIDLNPILRFMTMEFCQNLPSVCLLLEEGAGNKMQDQLDILFGKTNPVNLDRLGEHYMFGPAGSGWKQFIHYAQIIKNKKFQRYDYGEEGNRVIYKQATVPEYHLENINVPMMVLDGAQDVLSNPTDIQWLLNDSGLRSKDIVLSHQTYEDFRYQTFALGSDTSYLQRDVIPMIREQIRKQIDVEKKTKISYEQCKDDLGIFTLDAEKTVMTPSPPVKGAILEFKIVGAISKDLQIEKVITHVDWEDKPLYDEETTGDDSFSDIVEVTSRFNVPVHAPDGNYVNTFKGYTDDGQMAWCVTANYTL